MVKHTQTIRRQTAYTMKADFLMQGDYLTGLACKL